MSKPLQTFAVIMAGGVGTRFWPMSRTSKPKQFLDILGTGQSLIQMTFNRLSKVVPPSNILVVTNELYRDQVATHLTSLPSSNILCEPCMRNTAPCIAYANAVISERIKSRVGDESAGIVPSEVGIIVAPSDHLILDSTEFERVISLALSNACSTSSLLTLGIKPTRPDTGYGYIKFSGEGEVAKVEKFTEKPDLETAESFLAQGGYCWNSGIFVWSLKNISQAFSDHLPDMNASFVGAGLSGLSGEVDSIYDACESISIDYGILERADNVSVISCDFGWSDLGTWTSLASHIPLDSSGNGVSGSSLVTSQSSGNVVIGDAKKLVALRGLNDFIVVDTDDALLICPKTDEQWVKELVGGLDDTRK
ncbi:MAG TPA: mannose-1-phosphate guanylyltransferase [Flavobacteriales bacterium]|nr:mannose-1-phosphate guanylyltransferase [Flavobacteriales bacterium]